MTTLRNDRGLESWTEVYLPERELSESILDLAAPLLEPLGPTPEPDAVRRVLQIVIEIWNAHVLASPRWDRPKKKPLTVLRKSMCGKQAPPELRAAFEQLSERCRTEFWLDPRLVGEWTFEPTEGGGHVLSCQMELPYGVEAHVPPPLEKRIAIGGRFLDEVGMRLSAVSSLRFPIENHRGAVASDGTVTIHTKMATVIALFAQGQLPPIGGAVGDVMVGGKNLGSMILSEVSCADPIGHVDVAVLLLRPGVEATKST